MQANHQAAMDRILASEWLTIRFGASELGGASYGGVTLVAYGEYCAHNGLTAPTLDDWRANPNPLSAAQLEGFYIWDVLAPVQFDLLPSGMDYAIADGCVNDGKSGFLDIVRPLFRVPRPQAHWRMDDALLAALNGAEPLSAICAVCDARWAFMQAAKDFNHPSATTPGKIIGDGRAFRASSVFRGAVEIAGHAPVADRYQVFR